MDGLRALTTRVGACRLLLEQHPEGSVIHKALSGLQSAAICEMIASTEMTAEIRSEVSTRVVQVKWGCSDDCTAILAALTSNTPTLPAGKRRRLQQDYCNIVQYGAGWFWEQMATDIPSTSKLHMLLSLALSLGCRLPSEHTVKLFCSIWLAVSESREELLKMTMAQKKVMLNHVKSSWETHRKAAADPPQWITVLPDTPLLMLRDFASMYHAHFRGDQVPVSPSIDLKELMTLNMSYSCRGGARSVVPMHGSSQSASSSSSGSMQLGVGDSPLERMANTFMNRIDSMVTAQQRMMEVMVGVNSGRGATVGPRSLAALANGDLGSSLRRMPTFTFGNDFEESPPSMLALLPGELECETPPPTLQAASLRKDAHPALQAVTPPKATTSLEDVEQMLGMLSGRSEKRNVSAPAESPPCLKGGKGKGGKGGGKAMQLAIATTGPVDAPLPSVPLVEAKAALVGKAKGKGKAAPPPAVAKGKAKAKAAPPAAPPAAVVGKAKGKAQVKAKGKAKAAPPAAEPPVLGCSKCRWGPGGCAQCRKADYNGFRWSLEAA
jgi:hypothetical protein